VEDIRDVAELDLGPLGVGERPSSMGLEREPLFLVCTNGRRDPCCAERGRPLARALQRSEPDRTWECSHIGGDRFAGSVVCLPHGLFFGRVEPDEAADVVRMYREGRIDLSHYRGRSSNGFLIQAAEAHVRERYGLTGIEDVRLVERRGTAGEPGGVVATFRGPDDASIQARIRVAPADPARRLTCHRKDPIRPPGFEVSEI
jgi:hypothetical protein